MFIPPSSFDEPEPPPAFQFQLTKVTVFPLKLALSDNTNPSEFQDFKELKLLSAPVEFVLITLPTPLTESVTWKTYSYEKIVAIRSLLGRSS